MRDQKKQNQRPLKGTRKYKRWKQAQIKKVVVLLGALFVIGGICGGVYSGISHIVTNIKEEKAQEAAAQAKKEAEIQKKKEEAAAAKKAKEEAKQRVENNKLNPDVPVGTDVQSEEKVIYLTFDDGPSANTQAVLDVLDQYNAKATFFVTGLNPDYYDMIKVAYDKGHTIGMHTYSHDYSWVYSSTDAYFQDLEQIGNLVKEQIGFVPAFIRFPGGSSNTISANYTKGIMTQLSQEVIAKGYQYYDWNGDCQDGSGTLSPDELYNHAINAAGNNIMILCHDAIGKETTVQALPKIIEYYQAQGYVFKGIDRESFAPHHGINN